jgi:hypothetical protein
MRHDAFIAGSGLVPRPRTSVSFNRARPLHATPLRERRRLRAHASVARAAQRAAAARRPRSHRTPSRGERGAPRPLALRLMAAARRAGRNTAKTAPKGRKSGENHEKARERATSDRPDRVGKQVVGGPGRCACAWRGGDRTRRTRFGLPAIMARDACARRIWPSIAGREPGRIRGKRRFARIASFGTATSRPTLSAVAPSLRH